MIESNYSGLELSETISAKYPNRTYTHELKGELLQYSTREKLKSEYKLINNKTDDNLTTMSRLSCP